MTNTWLWIPAAFLVLALALGTIAAFQVAGSRRESSLMLAATATIIPLGVSLAVAGANPAAPEPLGVVAGIILSAWGGNLIARARHVRRY